MANARQHYSVALLQHSINYYLGVPGARVAPISVRALLELQNTTLAIVLPPTVASLQRQRTMVLVLGSDHTGVELPTREVGKFLLAFGGR